MKRSGPQGDPGRGIACMLAVLLLLGACSSGKERSEKHVERALEFLAEDRRREATLELESAIESDPDNVVAYNQLAALEFSVGKAETAITHIKEAYRIAPENMTAALNFALALREEQPGAALVVIQAAIFREPANPLGHIGLSDHQLAIGHIPKALAAGRKAIEVAPENPRGHWQYGTALQAKIRIAQIAGASPPADRDFKAAVGAFERYIDLGGAEPWKAQVEQARIMAAWPGRVREGAALLRIAVEHMFEAASPRIQLQGTGAAIEFGQAIDDKALQDWALTKRLQLQPQEFEAWVELARIRRLTGKDSLAVVSDLIAHRPTDTRAHIAYARELIQLHRLQDALDYLDEKAASPQIDGAEMLGAIANTQLAARRIGDAKKTLKRLEREYPDHPHTLLQRAQMDIREGDVQVGVAALRALVKHAESPEAYRLLAQTETRLGRKMAAIVAINNAILLTKGQIHDDQRTRARLLANDGDYRSAARNLETLQQRTALTATDKLLLATCLYQIGKHAQGRALLEELMTAGTPLAGAAIEWARREGARPENYQRASRVLEGVLARSPGNWRALQELARIDIANQRESVALTRLDDRIEQMPGTAPPTILLLRAQLNLHFGHPLRALIDATLAFQTNPRMRGPLELLVAIHLDRKQPAPALAALLEAERAGALDPSRRVLLGRVQRMHGDEDAALANFEAALASGFDDPTLKNDTAFLLAKRGRDLTRALQMAQEARTALADHPLALDTLGYVYLRSGDNDAALQHFGSAVKSDDPDPSFYYHLGLALQALDRSAEATDAFATALRMSKSFPEADETRRALEGAQRAGAS